MSTRSLTVSKSPGIKPSIAPGLRPQLSLGLQQLLERGGVDRLGDVLIEARFAREAEVPIFLVTAEGDEECVAEPKLTAHAFCDFVPVHLRHGDVEKHDLRSINPGAIQGLRPIVRGRDIVPAVAEQLAEGFGGIDIVVDDEYPPPRTARTHRRHGFGHIARRVPRANCSATAPPLQMAPAGWNEDRRIRVERIPVGHTGYVIRDGPLRPVALGDPLVLRPRARGASRNAGGAPRGRPAPCGPRSWPVRRGRRSRT